MGYLGEVWQRGFSEVRIEGQTSYLRHREYIAQNPVRAGLVDSPEKFPYCFRSLARQKAAGAKQIAEKQVHGMDSKPPAAKADQVFHQERHD